MYVFYGARVIEYLMPFDLLIYLFHIRVLVWLLRFLSLSTKKLQYVEVA